MVDTPWAHVFIKGRRILRKCPSCGVTLVVARTSHRARWDQSDDPYTRHWQALHLDQQPTS